MQHRMLPLALLAALLVGVGGGGPLGAQSIGVQVGDSARVVVAPGAKVGLPLRVDLAAAGSTLNLASLTGTLTWGPARLTFDSIRVNAATEFTQTANTAGAAGGSVALAYFNASRLAASAALATVWYTASATTGGTRVRFAASAAGNEAGQSVLGQLVPRGLDVCVAPQGRWGDVNDDGTVSIIDAQQIARSSVGLSVANAGAVAARGDVNADGTVSIIDAQQIARFSVGLSAAARVNTAQFTPPVVATLAVTPSPASTVVGQTVALVAVARDSAGAEVAGCVPVTYASSAPGVATVSGEGVVTGVSAGSATITVTAGARTATVSVTVTPPFVLSVATAAAGGTSNALLPTQPVVEVRDLSNALVTTVRSVTASLASGSGTLSGTTTVTTVNGVARFTDLAITGTGAHTLRFASTGLADITATPVTIAAPTTMRLLVGAAPTLAGTAGTDVVIPLGLDLQGRGTQNLAAITTTVTWDPAKYTFVAHGAGTWVDDNGDPATVTVNANNVATGTISISGFTNEGTTASGLVLRTITLRPVATGPVTVSATVSAAGNVSGQAVTVVPRQLGEVAPPPPAPPAGN
jgi:hypothetical protein